MKNKSLLLLSAASAAMAVTGCASTGAGNTPDEFRVVTKAPLVVPPDYNLRPPEAGATLPVEVDPARAESASAFGVTMGQSASGSEKALVAMAGANAVNPVIRDQVDWEEAKVLRKNQSFTDRVLFWRGDNPEDQASAAEDNATGGGDVTIERAGGSPRIKLPGT